VESQSARNSRLRAADEQSGLGGGSGPCASVRPDHQPPQGLGGEGITARRAGQSGADGTSRQALSDKDRTVARRHRCRARPIARAPSSPTAAPAYFQHCLPPPARPGLTRPLPAYWRPGETPPADPPGTGVGVRADETVVSADTPLPTVTRTSLDGPLM